MAITLTIEAGDLTPLAAWMRGELAQGAKVFALEAPAGSETLGLARHLEPLVERLQIVSVDDHWRARSNRTPWNENLRTTSLRSAIRRKLSAGPVLVEGLVAWAAAGPFVKAISGRRLFLRATPVSGPSADPPNSSGSEPPTAFWESVHDYHRAGGYGARADLVVETA